MINYRQHALSVQPRPPKGNLSAFVAIRVGLGGGDGYPATTSATPSTTTPSTNARCSSSEGWFQGFLGSAMARGGFGGAVVVMVVVGFGVRRWVLVGACRWFVRFLLRLRLLPMTILLLLTSAPPFPLPRAPLRARPEHGRPRGHLDGRMDCGLGWWMEMGERGVGRTMVGCAADLGPGRMLNHR
ncbi:hypothetical protein DFP72DRAFT_932695 [Ephemerocybe angulata]|uniref:Uncharacterized protein n=1 Tax=Ephemerocybe angulata TaxID=980116 RepID=A0A8H6HAW3_9AGAR|nr:hypothetical protein DFP72DRAFT_932695 [Tulosesus angulatus]